MENFPKNPSLKSHMLALLWLVPILWLGMAFLGAVVGI